MDSLVVGVNRVARLEVVVSRVARLGVAARELGRFHLVAACSSAGTGTRVLASTAPTAGGSFLGLTWNS